MKRFSNYFVGLARLQNLMDIQSMNADTIKLRNIADYEQDIRVLWKEAEETLHEQRLIMDCEPESLVKLISSAKDFKLLGPFKVWLFLFAFLQRMRMFF